MSQDSAMVSAPETGGPLRTAPPYRRWLALAVISWPS